jgi:aspartyl-tRNA(Asn)/glutamyl-tRNA(Gln) amidotransferase subunit B
MGQTGKPADQIVKEKGLVQITDTDELDDVVSNILSENPAEVEAFKNGKTKLMGFFVGQVMKMTKGKANPKLVNEILKRKLG